MKFTDGDLVVVEAVEDDGKFLATFWRYEGSKWANLEMMDGSVKTVESWRIRLATADDIMELYQPQ